MSVVVCAAVRAAVCTPVSAAVRATVRGALFCVL